MAHSAPIPARVERRGAAWWIVPLVIVGLVVIAWLLLAGLPFGRDDERRADAPAVETIAEGNAPSAAQPPSSATIVDVTEDEGGAPPNVTTVPVTATAPVTAAPVPVPTPTPTPVPSTTTRVPVPATTTRVPPVTAPRPAPAPVRDVPAPAPAPAREISEEEAANVLRGYVTSRRYYEGVSSECVQLRGSGYANVGYGFSVWDSCVSGGGSRMLGRWRVDSKTREVFRQRDDGRYLRP